MTKNNKIIVGILLALVAYRFYAKNSTKNEIQNLKDELDNLPAESEVDKKAQESECKKEWMEKIGKLSRFPSAEAAKNSELNYIKSCLKNK